MKRVLIVVPFVLLILLDACGSIPGRVGPADWAAVAGSMTATAWTPTISPTPEPLTSKMVEWLNNELRQADALEQTIEAHYQVVGVSFPMQNGIANVLRVDIRCECSTYEQCCNPERMFIRVMSAMMGGKKKEILNQVPGTVTWLNVVCFDRMTEFQVMSAPWEYVRSYLQEKMTGYELGSQVIRGRVP